MEINKIGTAGTLESNDILIIASPNEENKIDIELESIVMKQFGEEIRGVIFNKLKSLDVTSVKIKAQDKGALNYAIEARVEAAIMRTQEL